MPSKGALNALTSPFNIIKVQRSPTDGEQNAKINKLRQKRNESGRSGSMFTK